MRSTESPRFGCEVAKTAKVDSAVAGHFRLRVRFGVSAGGAVFVVFDSRFSRYSIPLIDERPNPK